MLVISERRACKVLEQPRSTLRHEPQVRDDEQALTNGMVGLATRFGRYGYRRNTALLRHAGLDVNHKRVESAGEAAKERLAVAELRILRQAEAGKEESRVGL